MSDGLSVTGIGIFEAYEELYLELAPKIALLEKLKERIKSEVLLIGESASHGKVKATYKKGYTRVTWDSKGLDGYAVAHPEVRALREEKGYGASVSVSVMHGAQK